jgi:hypothetical protein
MEEITEWHKHEMLDRLHCLHHMFEELIAEHPAASLLPIELNMLSEALGAAYQAAGQVYLDGVAE